MRGDSCQNSLGLSGKYEMSLSQKKHHVGNAKPLRLSSDVKSKATYGGMNDCYRYVLERVWDASKPAIMWLMMNPSVATEYGDDRTVAKCQRYSRRWGYGRMYVGNTFAYRCTDQKRLKEVSDPVGPGNDKALRAMADISDIIIAAYGAPRFRDLRQRGRDVLDMLRQEGHAIYALRIGKTGAPCHPLYLPEKLQPTLMSFDTNN